MPLFGAATTNLVYLDFHGNKLSGVIPPTIGLSTALTYLDFGSNSIAGSIPTSMVALTKLVYLDLSVNRINGQIPASIGSLASLTTLLLNNNRLTGGFPAGLATFTGMTALSSAFTLQNNFLTGALPTDLAAATTADADKVADGTTQNIVRDDSAPRPGASIAGSQVFTGVTVAFANSALFNAAYKDALSGIVGVPVTQITLGDATAITLATRRELEEIHANTEEEEAARAIEEAIANGEEPIARELKAFNPNPTPSTTISKPFSLVVFSTQIVGASNTQAVIVSVTSSLVGAGSVSAITTLVSTATGLTTLVAMTPTIVSSAAVALTPTLAPTPMPTYAAIAAAPTSRTIVPPPFTAPADKAKRCAQCQGQNYCPVPLGCF